MPNVKKKSRDRRNHLIALKVTAEEKRLLEAALRENETVSAFVRAAALHLCAVRAARETI